MSRRKPLACLLIIALLATGCRSLRPDARGTVSGINYRLPKTVLEVEAKRTSIVQNKVDNGELKPDNSVEVASTLVVQTLPDKTSFTLDMPSSSIRDSSMTITVSPDGFLQNVNSASQGKSGEILGNVFQIVGKIFGLGLVGAAGDPANDVAQRDAVRCINENNELPASVADDYLENGAPDRSRFDDDVTFYAVTHSEDVCRSWKQVLIMEHATRRERAELREQEALLSGKYGDDADEIESRVRSAEIRVRRAEAKETSGRDEFGVQLGRFKKVTKLAAQKQPPKVTHLFLEPSSLPPASLFLNAQTAAQFKQALSDPKYAAIKSLVNSGVALASDDFGVATVEDQKCEGEGTIIRYRVPRSLRLAIYEESEADKFTRKGEQLIRIFDQSERCIAVPTSAWASRSLAVEFEAAGVPKSLQRTHTSSLAAATGGVSNAITSLQTAYSESLDKLVAIQTTRRTIDNSDTLDAIAKAQKEKELLDARLALEGAAASQDLILQQKLAEQRLALLEKELALQKAEAGKASQLELDALKTRLALLEQQLAVLKAQKELEEKGRTP